MWINEELLEARYYRNLSKQYGKSVNDLASSIFDHLLMVYTLYHVKPKVAKKYSADMMKNVQFDGFRQSMPDFYNLLTLVIQQKKYADKLFNNWDIKLPELRIKRVFRQIAQEELDLGQMDQLLMILQRMFKGLLSGDQLIIRRILNNWSKANSTQRQFAVNRLVQTMRRPINTDLYELFKTNTKDFQKKTK